MTVTREDREPVLRCAIYVRPIRNICRGLAENQLAICNDEIARLGWLIVPEYVVTEHCDATIPIAQCPGLQLLLQSTQLDPKPFDRIVIAGSVYIDRNPVEVCSVQEKFSLHGVSIYIASSDLDLADPFSRMLLSLPTLLDAQYSKAHGLAISKGIQKKRMERIRAA